MVPLRIGLIGLSTSAKTSWASSTHLPYLKSSPNKYVITALCNSTLESAQSAVTSYNLDPSTKAYGDPEALAADPDIDLVVCCVRVDKHYETIKPSILAGKHVFVEWPLASNLPQGLELHKLAQQKGIRTMIGLQARVSPIVLKLKSLLDEGRIGPVLSSTVAAVSGVGASDQLSSGLAYFLDRKVGGNGITIAYAHMIDYIHFVLGEFSEFQAHSAVVQKEVKIMGSEGEVLETVETDVPDFLTVHGTLEGEQKVPLAVTFRRWQPFKGTSGLDWHITGTKGEIRITSPKPILNALDEGTEILVEEYATREVEKVEWKHDYQDQPLMARNVAGLYEAFAKGDEYPDFEVATRRLRELDEVFRSAEEGRMGKYV